MSVHLKEVKSLSFSHWSFYAHKIISFYRSKEQLRTQHNKQGSNKQTAVQSQHEQKAVQSQHDVVLVSLLLALNIFHTFF